MTKSALLYLLCMQNLCKIHLSRGDEDAKSGRLCKICWDYVEVVLTLISCKVACTGLIKRCTDNTCPRPHRTSSAQLPLKVFTAYPK